MLSKAVVVGAYQRKLEELARRPGLELTVIAPPAWRDSRGESRLERAYTTGYHLIETPIVLKGHFHSHFYPHLAQVLDASRPDLLHIDEEPYNLAAWQAMRWAVRRRIPALFFTWQNLYRSYPPPFRWMERYCYRHAAFALAGNQEAEAVLRAKSFSGPVAVVPQFGVDPHLFHEATGARMARRPRPGLIVGYAGGLVQEKGVADLLRAAAACNASLGAARYSMERGDQAESLAIPCRVRLAGTGPAEASLQALCAELGLAPWVSFLGRLASTEMPDFYASIDVFVLPSRTLTNWKEQFGRVLIEAMACGVPVIGSDSGEIPNVIGGAGWVFPEGDSEALAQMLAQLASNPALRAELGQLGRKRVLDYFTQERVAAATYEVYQCILSQE